MTKAVSREEADARDIVDVADLATYWVRGMTETQELRMKLRL